MVILYVRFLKRFSFSYLVKDSPDFYLKTKTKNKKSEYLQRILKLICSFSKCFSWKNEYVIVYDTLFQNENFSNEDFWYKWNYVYGVIA